LILFSSLACNAFAGNLQPIPEPPVLPEQTPSRETPAEMAATATLTETGVTVTTLVDLNVRSGPSVRYDRLGFLAEGVSANVIGRDPNTGWYRITCPELVEGESCWVSGGAQYVVVSDSENIPAAEAPATPTSQAPDEGAEALTVAYLDNGALFTADLIEGQDSPFRLVEAKQVSAGSGVQHFAFSPDGRQIAYVAGNANRNSLQVASTAGGSQRLLVESNTLQLYTEQDSQSEDFVINDIQWLPDGDGIAFNTLVVDQFGAGSSERVDLWIASSDGQVDEVLPAGEGGGSFVFQPDGQLLLSRVDEIARLNLESQELSEALSFEAVDTAGEAAFYPQPQITTGGVFVAIHDEEPSLPGANTSLYLLPLDSPAEEIGSISDVDFLHPVVWSPSGRQLAFIEKPTAVDQTIPRLLIAAGDGSGAVAYSGGANLVFLAWEPDDEGFIYAGAGFYALGRLDEPTQQQSLSSGLFARLAEGISQDSFIVSVDDPGNQQWILFGVGEAGERSELVQGAGAQSKFAIWIPE
jgi:Bacterial SH3 domain/WD40-like Beta Propeller Repeat